MVASPIGTSVSFTQLFKSTSSSLRKRNFFLISWKRRRSLHEGRLFGVAPIEQQTKCYIIRCPDDEDALTFVIDLHGKSVFVLEPLQFPMDSSIEQQQLYY